MLGMKKICCKCKDEKPISGFYKNKSTADGFAYECKDCCYSYSEKYRNKNKDKINKYMRDRRKRIAVENPKPSGEFDVIKVADKNGLNVKQKKCTRCKKIKTIKNYSFDKNVKSGLKAACKACAVESNKLPQFIKRNKYLKENTFYYCNVNVYYYEDVQRLTGLSANGVTGAFESGSLIKPIKPTLSDGKRGRMYWPKEQLHQSLAKRNRMMFFLKNPITKTCTDCKETKVSSLFYKKMSGGYDSKTPKCKNCISKQQAGKRRSQKRLEKDKEWRSKKENKKRRLELQAKNIKDMTDGYLSEKLRNMRGVNIRGIDIPNEILVLKRIQLKLYREIYK